MAVTDELLNCDLCILAYQLYHQSVLWPLDPWYEVLARGATNRRTRFMAKTHEYARSLGRADGDLYAGPACVGGQGDSNATLDPVLTNFSQLRPRDPAFTGDGAVFIALQAPAYLVNTISRVSACTYSSAWRSAWPHGQAVLTSLVEEGGGEDELIAFEGGTGSFKDSAAAWSPMGFVLKRTRDDGTYDAHIVFRGSRSGNAVRALLGGRDGWFNGPTGNADWVTDMASGLQRDAYVGGDGTVAVGFAAALKRCMGTLQAALRELNRKYGAPQTIQVSGHSLGAALASLCIGALTSGTPGVELRKALPGWRGALDAVQGYLLALPPVGNKDYCTGYNGNAAGRVVAPYVAGDPVVECSKSVSFGDTGAAGFAGAQLGSGGYTPGTLERLPRPMGARSDENSHEIYLIRAALLGKAQRAQVVLADGMRNVTPWATYVSFADMLDGRPVSYAAGGAASIVTRDNLRRVLTNYRFARHFEAFLDMLKSAVADPKGYRGYHQDATYQLAGERVLVALEMCGNIDSDNRDVIVDTVGTQVAALLGYAVKKEYVRQGWKVRKQPVADGDGVALTADALLGQDFNTRIGLGLILRALEEKENTRLADYEKTPELKLCLEVALPDVSGAQSKLG